MIVLMMRLKMPKIQKNTWNPYRLVDMQLTHKYAKKILSILESDEFQCIISRTLRWKKKFSNPNFHGYTVIFSNCFAE